MITTRKPTKRQLKKIARLYAGSLLWHAWMDSADDRVDNDLLNQKEKGIVISELQKIACRLLGVNQSYGTFDKCVLAVLGEEDEA